MKQDKTRMWAAQPNIGGAVGESFVILSLVARHKVWLTAAARVPCINADNIGECKLWRQSEFCSWQISVRGQEPSKCVYRCRRRPNIWCKVWFTSVERSRCSNEAKTRNPLKFARVPQTRQQISARQPLVGRSSSLYILYRHMQDILPFNKFFPIVDTCLSCEDISRQSCAMERRWRFLA